jgi:glycosyltransferase involved in cell wall biosynthesis
MSERVIALIPAFNEAARVADVVAGARGLVDEVVVIDDGSRDQTAAVAEAAGAMVLRHPVNRGKGAAILTALEFFRQSPAEFALFLDADGQHDPAEIPRFVTAARATGADIVIGTRMGQTARMPLIRRCANRWTSWVTSRLAGQGIPDSQCGYRLLRRAVLPDLNLATRHFETETEMLIQAGRAGHQIVSIPIRTIYEPNRASRIHPWRDTLRFFGLVKKYWP